MKKLTGESAIAANRVRLRQADIDDRIKTEKRMASGYDMVIGKEGETGICANCGEEIINTGLGFWDHVGLNNPRHIATPDDLDLPPGLRVAPPNEPDEAEHGNTHSPTPWRINNDSVIVDADGVVLMSPDKPNDELEANARLIVESVNTLANLAKCLIVTADSTPESTATALRQTKGAGWWAVFKHVVGRM